jgi:hypothetical protein
MAANIDYKELLIKHRFWVGLGISVVMILIIMIMMPSIVGNSVIAKQKDYDASAKSLKGVKDGDVKNEKFVEALNGQDKKVASRRDVVWAAAWKPQESMMTWPPNLEERWSRKYPYFGDPIEVLDQNKFCDEYQNQIPEVVNLVQPLNEKGEGVVQFNSGWDAVLQLTHKFEPPASDEDIWLAQEDLWVKRELLAIVRDCNDSLARFQEVVPEDPAAKAKPPEAKPAPKKEDPALGENPGEEKDKKEAKPTAPPAKPKPVTDPYHRKYRNPYWEFDLKLTRNDRGGRGAYLLSGTIKNIGKGRQAVDTDFRIYLDDTFEDSTPVAVIHVAHLPMNVNESAPIVSQEIPAGHIIKGIFGVEQVLTWLTGPVKRIDKIELGKSSSRTDNFTLKPPTWIKSAAPAGGEGAGADSGNAQADMMSQGMMGRKGGGGMGRGGAATNEDLTKSGLRKNRYTDANKQVRHMPIGILVTMDEDHIHDFLGSVANNRMRIQILQVHWRHTHEKIKPEVKEDEAPPSAGGDKQGPSGMPQFRLQQSLPQMPSMPGGGMGMGGMPGMKGRRQDRGGLGGGGGGKAPPMMGRFPGGMGTPITGMPGTRMPGMQMPGSMASPGEGESDEPTNLVELAVYGLASLYERYPAKPEAPPADANAPTADTKK